MENRSYALWAGLFTLALIVAAVLVAIWLGRDKTAVVVYEITSSSPVSGLSAQSAVRFQGVPVGRVQALLLDPDKPGQVRIRVGVAPTTPVTEGTWAELGLQGVTGFATIELRDEGKSPRRLETSTDRPAVIPLRPGLFARVEEKGMALLDALDRAAGQVRVMLSPENVQALSAVLQNTAEFSAQLKQAGARVGPLADHLDATVRQMGETARQTSELVRDAHAALARFSAPDGPLALATQSLRQITQAAARLDTQTLPALSGMADSVGSSARKASATLQRVGDAPQALLFGLPPAQPGPGEEGFAGFGGTR